MSADLKNNYFTGLKTSGAFDGHFSYGIAYLVASGILLSGSVVVLLSNFFDSTAYQWIVAGVLMLMTAFTLGLGVAKLIDSLECVADYYMNFGKILAKSEFSKKEQAEHE